MDERICKGIFSQSFAPSTLLPCVDRSGLNGNVSNFKLTLVIMTFVIIVMLKVSTHKLSFHLLLARDGECGDAESQQGNGVAAKNDGKRLGIKGTERGRQIIYTQNSCHTQNENCCNK